MKHIVGVYLKIFADKLWKYSIKGSGVLQKTWIRREQANVTSRTKKDANASGKIAV
jgi:hypothetical protein